MGQMTFRAQAGEAPLAQRLVGPHSHSIGKIQAPESVAHGNADAAVRVGRKELRARGIRHHRVLWSPEEPKEAAQHEAPHPGRRSVPGSVAWVPPVAGLMMAGDVICSLTGTQI